MGPISVELRRGAQWVAWVQSTYSYGEGTVGPKSFYTYVLHIGNKRGHSGY